MPGPSSDRCHLPQLHFDEPPSEACTLTCRFDGVIVDKVGFLFGPGDHVAAHASSPLNYHNPLRGDFGVVVGHHWRGLAPYARHVLGLGRSRDCNSAPITWASYPWVQETCQPWARKPGFDSN